MILIEFFNPINHDKPNRIGKYSPRFRNWENEKNPQKL